jgi:hypothetical protein
MKYPKHMGPDSQAAELSWLYSSLAAAWSLVAQYQELEQRIEGERIRERVFEAKPPPRNYGGDANEGVHPSEGPATEGGQSC